MLGYDMSWAAFNVIEVMSSSKFSYKRIGYLAASQSFGEQTDVLMLATNLIRKDLNSGRFYDTSVALSGFSCFVTTDLAKDLCDDILALTMSPKPYIAKKAILLLYKVFLKNPDALRAAFPRLKKKLEDPDPGVQSAAVNVICELARKNPQNYLSLSPIFFNLMTTSTNNWVLIKIIKLFGALTPLEPRLGKKLIEPLTNLIHNTSAMSLLYECINTVLAGVPDHNASIQLCVQKLRILIEDSDQNLKYLGLLAMGKILRHHPKSVQAHKDLILACLDDRDESIRLRALDLLHGMVSRSSLVEIVRSLVRHLSSEDIGPHFRGELIATVVKVCSQENYQYVMSFEWYVSVLMELAQLNYNRNGELLANQLLDVVVRVAAVRPFAVSQMAIFLRSCKSIIVHSNKASLYDVIYAAAWICGEYAGFLEEPQQILEAMLETANLPDLRGHIQSVLVLNSLKLYCKLAVKWLSESLKGCKIDTPELKLDNVKPSLSELQDLTKRLLELTNFLMDKISQFVHSAYLEVQERAVSIHQLLHLMAKRLSKFRVQSGTSSSSQVAANATADLLGVNTEETLDPLEDLESYNKLGDDHETEHSASAADSLLRGLYTLIYELSSLFEGELNPVAPKAQRKVPVPEGLDLDAWINAPPQVDSNAPSEGFFSSKKKSKKSKPDKEWTLVPKSSEGGIFTGILEPEGPRSVKLTPAELEDMRKQRLLLQESNPHYLKTSKNSKPNPDLLTSEMLDTSKPPEPQPSSGLKLANSDMFALNIQRQLKEKSKTKPKKSTSRDKGSKKSKKPKKNESHEPNLLEDVAIESPTDVAVSTVLDLPEGVEPNELDSSDDGNGENSNDPHRLLNIPLEDLIPAPPPPLPKKSNGGKKRKVKNSVNSTKSEEAVKTSIISEEDFLKLLASSTLAYSSKCKVRCPASTNVVNGLSALPIERVFEDLLNKLSSSSNICVIERIGNSASLYSEFESNPVCLLIKLSTQTGSISIEAKSTHQSSADQLVQKLKPIVKAFRGND
nr:Clathrin coatomer adaptor adaptin N terminal [Hymenolepis microstoma]